MRTASSSSPSGLDAVSAITADLQRVRRERRARFVPAALLAALVVVGGLLVTQVRPDLLEQPPAQLAVQVAGWVSCLLVLPAIGVGLMFPGRGARVGWVVLAILTTATSVTGWPFDRVHLVHAGSATHGLGCLGLVLGAGALLLAIGLASGAFLARHRRTGVYWIAAGLALVALNLVTSHCPRTGLMHVLPQHLGGAATLLGVTVAIALWMRAAATSRTCSR